MSLAAALVEFQSKVPAIPKNKVAKIPTKSGPGYSYNYADLSDIWDAIRAPLKECGLAVTQGLSPGGLTTKIWHTSGETYEERVEFDTTNRTPQEAGSVITYYRRYALTAMLGISTEEDDDGKSVSTPRAATRPPKLSALETAKAELREAMASAGLSDEQMADYIWVGTATDADIDKIRGAAAVLRMGKAV